MKAIDTGGAFFVLEYEDGAVRLMDGTGVRVNSY
jgi:hypothetical protein